MRENKIQVFISFFVYQLSGIVIFNPLFTSGNIGLSCLVSAAVSAVIFEIYLFVLKKEGCFHSKIFFPFFAIITCLLSVFCTIIYLTEIIKDIAFISGKNVSLFYYSLLAFAILFVSYYLCYNTEKGIFRFSLLSFSMFALFIIVISLSFLTTKKLFWNGTFDITLSSICCGILSGIFFAIDIPLYLSVFSKAVSIKDNAKSLRFSFLAAVIFYCVINLLPFMILGQWLTNSISNPIFSVTKLFPQADMTEAVAVIKIIGFMIKSSVYIFFTSSIIKKSVLQRTSRIIVILLLYSSIPLIFLTISMLDKSLEYGAFQHLIYAATSGLGIFSAISCFFKNKSYHNKL